MMKKVLVTSVVLLFSLQLFSTHLFMQNFYLYGGEDYYVYLGCITCSRYDDESIWNENGEYGNRNSLISIWNGFGRYGDMCDDCSPWNEFATKPPIIVDKQGNFHGYFTLNETIDNRANFEFVRLIYDNYQFIREDVESWYDTNLEKRNNNNNAEKN